MPRSILRFARRAKSWTVSGSAPAPVRIRALLLARSV